MPNQAVIISMLALLLITTSIFSWLVKLANEQRERIVTGAHQGVQLSNKHRRVIFSNDWLGFKFFPIGVLLVVGYGLLLIGRSAADADIRVVSFLSAFLMVSTAAFTVVLGVADLIFILAVLRQSKQRDCS